MKPQINKQRVLEGGLRAILLAATMLVCAGPAPAAEEPGAKQLKNPKIIPPGTIFRGLTYGEWGAQWWKAAFSIPVVAGDHPLFSGGAFGEHNGVVFLAAVGGGATIAVTIPDGSAIFVPVINTECSVLEPDPFHGDNEAGLRACANDHIDHTSGRFAMIDGVPVKNLDAYRVESPLFEFGPLPADNLFAFLGLDAPAGTTSLSVDAGVYVLVAPLTIGYHMIQVKGTADDLGFSFDTTFNITVTPGRNP